MKNIRVHKIIWFITYVYTLGFLLFIILNKFFDSTNIPMALDDQDLDILFLKGIGNLFLFIVSATAGFLMFASLILIPWIVYLKLKKDKESLKDFNELIIPFAIIIGAIALLSIAGVQLRGLKQVDDKPTEVRIVEP